MHRCLLHLGGSLWLSVLDDGVLSRSTIPCGVFQGLVGKRRTASDLFGIWDARRACRRCSLFLRLTVRLIQDHGRSDV